LLIRLEKLSCRLADHIIATNESYKAMEIERSGVAPQRVTVVRNGPDCDRLRPTQPDLALVSPGMIQLVYAGVMGVQDGVDFLLRALAHLLHDLGQADFHCVLVGDGSASSDLDTLGKELSLCNHVTFTGWLGPEQVARYLATADICVAPEPSNPYNDRSTMIKMMEYMSVAKPIVAFDLPEHRVTAEDAAVYATPNNELDFARQIASLMVDPQRRQAMGQIGRAKAEYVLAWRHQQKSLLQAYAKLDITGQRAGRRAAKTGYDGLRHPSTAATRKCPAAKRFDGSCQQLPRRSSNRR
jgi:glycosyltransferase involved in cell wall biosynthesis